MDYVNKDNTITIDNVKFDIPLKENLTKWDYKEWKENRSVFKELWLESYQNIGTSTCRMCYCLLNKNNTTFTLDNKKLKGLDVEKAKYLFNNIF